MVTIRNISSPIQSLSFTPPHAESDPIVDEVETSPDLDREVLKSIYELRSLQQESARHTLLEVKTKQKVHQALHKEHNTLLESLEKDSKLSDKINWVFIGTSGGLIVLSVASLAYAIATGNVSALLQTVQVIAGVATGVIGGASTALQLEMVEKQGKSLAFKEHKALDQSKVHSLLSENQLTNDRANSLWKVAAKILRVQQKTLKLFSMR